MAIVAKERARLSGGHDRRTLTYYVKRDDGSALSPEDAVDHVLDDSVSPATYYGLPKVDYEYDELATDRYDVRVVYAARSLSIVRPEPAIGEAQYSFGTQLETVHIQTSLQTVAAHYDAAQVPAGTTTAYDFQQCINVDVDQRVRGTTIQVPVTRFKYRFRVAAGAVTQAYQIAVENLTGLVNNATFKGRPAGSVRFDGCTGSIRSAADWDLEYAFTRRPNLTDLTIGNITGIDADGWDYIWPFYIGKSAGDRGFSAPSPAYVYVERIYARGDFSTLGIP